MATLPVTCALAILGTIPALLSEGYRQTLLDTMGEPADGPAWTAPAASLVLNLAMFYGLRTLFMDDTELEEEGSVEWGLHDLARVKGFAVFLCCAIIHLYLAYKWIR